MNNRGEIRLKNICFVIGVLSNGGAERVISILAKEFSELGYHVNIVTIYGDENDYIDEKEINVYPIVKRSKNKILKYFVRVIGLRKAIKEIKPDVVISFVGIVNIYTVVASMFLRKQIILSERNDPYQNPENIVLRKIRDIIYNFADKIVFQTEDAKKYFCKRIQNKGVVISNPIKPNLPCWKEKDADKVIITACRLSRQKNLPLLINAFSDLNKDHPDYKLKIFGIGSMKEDLERLIDSLNLNNKVELPGFSKKVHDEMSKATMFVISSDYEGISNSMLEALAMGMPVISTDSPVGGARMFIESGRNGILTKVGDRSGLYNAMKTILSDQQFALKLSSEARKVKTKISQDVIVKKWIRIIEDNGED